MRIKKDIFDVESIEKGQYFLKILVFDKNAKMHCNLITIYEDAQIEEKASFLAELARLYHDNLLPCLVGGDFNIIRKISESGRRKNFLNGLIRSNELNDLELDG